MHPSAISMRAENARPGASTQYGDGMNPAAAPEPTVAVRGAWHGEVQPELARVLVGVTARGGDRDRILTQISDRVREVRTTLDRYGDAVERVDASPLRVIARFKSDKPTEKVSGYVAEVGLTLVVVDFTVLGDMLLRLADEEMVTVDGPYWALRPDSAAYRRARTAAVQDARTRAEEYAAAAGSRLTGLVEIADTGLSRGAGDHFPEAVPAAMRHATARGSVADRVTFDVEPVPQEVSASVEARFRLTQPDFS